MAYAQKFEAFEFNATPMAPPVTKIIAHEKTNQRATWSNHGVAGWFIGPELEHYRCYKLFVTEKYQKELLVYCIFPLEM